MKKKKTQDLNQESSDRSLILLLLFSIALHTLFFLWAYSDYRKEQSGFTEFSQKAPSAVTTRVLTPEQFQKETGRNIVQSQEAPLVKNPKTAAHYLGERTQRVEKETRAQGFGSAHGGKKGEKVEKKAEKNPVKRLEQLGLSRGLGPTISSPKEEKKESGDGGDGILKKGAMDLSDENIAIGTETLLNTDEYLYASFFNRLKDDVGPRWEPLIQMAIDSKRKIEPGVYRTAVNARLNSEGEIESVQVQKASGVESFDQAAVTSLHQVLRIKNPPQGLREKDGSYKLQLTFVVNLGGGGLVRMNYEPDPRYRVPPY